MRPEELTNENYHSIEAKQSFMGASQFKDFLKCEACALARVNGEIEEKKSSALLVGSYIDAYFSGEMEQFTKDHLEIFKKDGTLKSDFIQAEEIIKVIENDEMLSKYLDGEHQVIMTGTIAGVPFKIKMDSYFPDQAIVDQKIMKDLEPIWIDGVGKVNFVEAWGYQYQGAIYREIVRQNTGKTLPFILAVTTKETVPNKALLRIDDEDLDVALEKVKEMAPRFQQIKEGKIAPEKCGTCDYCVSNKKITGIFSYHCYDPYKEI